MYEELKKQAAAAAKEIISLAKLRPGDILVVGCSSSEAAGKKIGSDSNEDIGRALFAGIWEEAKKAQVYVAAQCCEHLNRALILEEAAARAYALPPVNVVPQKKAGGSFATAAYASFNHPVAVEEMHCAKAGLDIGDTLIGMHMDKVCVPVRLSMRKLGEANLVACRVRPKFIGGERALYDKELD
ncbi:MAG TPA: TIGR01440 family protein [Clostridiales bacterium]|nr:TIGR01440 family protein [Clostridiales bacterium]